MGPATIALCDVTQTALGEKWREHCERVEQAKKGRFYRDTIAPLRGTAPFIQRVSVTDLGAGAVPTLLWQPDRRCSSRGAGQGARPQGGHEDRAGSRRFAGVLLRSG